MEIVEILNQAADVLAQVCVVSAVICFLTSAFFKFMSGANEEWGPKSKQLFVSGCVAVVIYLLIPGIESLMNGAW